jgi:hypothetical protein
MAEMPNVGGLNGPDWQNFMIPLPGSAGAPGSAAGDSNPGPEVSTNGYLTFTNVLADGATTSLPSSQNATRLRRRRRTTSLFVLVLSSVWRWWPGHQPDHNGWHHKFHGAAYEYLQNDALDAANFGFGNKQSVPFLRYDNFGGTVGGPVAALGLKKKAFLLFGYDQMINKGVSTGTDTVPTTDIMAGKLDGSYTLYDPTTQTIAMDSNGNPYPV